MATITKHIGKMKDAGTRVAVVFRTLPEEKDSAWSTPPNPPSFGDPIG